MLKISKAQIMHLLAIPLTAVGGLVAAYVSKILPVHIDFTAVFVTGAGSALTLLIHYLHGWQLWERTVGKLVDVEDAGAAAKPAAGRAAHRQRTPGA